MDSEMAQHYAKSNRNNLETLSQLPTEKLPILLRKRNQEIEVTKCLGALLEANSPNYIEVVKKTALVIYAIRNNLFHGNYDPVSEDAQKHVTTAEVLLSSLVRELIVKELTGKSLAGPIVFPETLKI